MRALTWQGREKVSVETVPDPRIEQPTDAVVRITSSGLCGSDLHLYSTLGMYLSPGDVLGHEPMGIVEEVGAGVTHIAPGDRVVVPFTISCGSCWTCSRQLYAQCETTQVRAQGKGASLFGYTEMYGSVPGGQAELLRVPQAHFGPIKVPHDGPDEQYLYLSDVLPTAWQAVEYALVPEGGTVVVIGLGPIGQMCARIALHRGAGRVIGIDTVRERQVMAGRHGVTVLDGNAQDVLEQVLDLTDGRGADSVIDAVGMEAHGSPVPEVLQKAVGFLPDVVAKKVTETLGFDRLSALHAAFSLVRRGGTVSISGVYGGALDPMPMMDIFDKGLTLKMGQANVRRWTDELVPLCADPADPLGVLDLETHRVPLEDAADWYGKFQRKEDGAVKIVFAPVSADRRVVLVTGASSGIGRATAEACAARGDRLVLTSRSAAALEAVRVRCVALGAEVVVAVADVTDRAQVQAAVDAAVDTYGRLDVCVSSAAVMSYGTHAETPADVFDRVVAVNLLGAANVARSALAVFRRQRAGTLVVVGSVLGRIAVPLAGSYVTSKWGLRGLTRVLRQENRDLPGVHVTSVAPGAVRTPIYRQAASYLGRAGHPPPPATTPERVARQVLRAVERPVRERDADALGGVANVGMTVAFTVAPGLYDVLVGPMMRTLGVARESRPRTDGNVFEPVPELEE